MANERLRKLVTVHTWVQAYSAEVGESRAPFEIYPGAVYLSQGEAYLVERLDLPTRWAEARQATISYYTQTRSTTDMAIRQTRNQTKIGDTAVSFDMVRVTHTVTSFVCKRHFSEELLDETDLVAGDPPPAGRLPLSGRLPSLHSVTQVWQWQSATEQGWGACAGSAAGLGHCAKVAGFRLFLY